MYTPTASFTIGGHFYSYDSCHLTEVGRRFGALLQGEFTNQVHHHAFETIVQMVIGLPRSDPSRSKSSYRVNPFFISALELKVHSVVALCLMVLHPRSYAMKEHATQLSQAVRHAQSIATEIIKRLGHGALGRKHPYFEKRSYLDAGEVFAWQLGLEKWHVLS